MTKKAEAEKIRAYHEKLESTNAADFRDKPDPVESIRILNSFHDSIVFEWDKPCDNNEEIILYNVYVGEQKQFEIDSALLYQTEATADQNIASYKVTDLEPDQIYYVRVFAVNSKGEGYPAKQPFFARTMKEDLTEPGSLYVWGNNASSELGLTDEMVEDNKASYERCAMFKPIRQPMFDGIVYDVAAGNINTLFHCVNKETKDTFVVMCGMTTTSIDGEEIEKNELLREDIERL